MAKSVKKQVESARKLYEQQVRVIFTYAEHGHMPFSECLKRASESARSKLDAARQELDALEYQAVRQGKAWRASFGMLTWYR